MLHFYDMVTKEYVESIEEGVDALGNPLTYYNATKAKLPAKKTNTVRVFNGSSWDLVPDFRWDEGYLDGKPFRVEKRGEKPEGFATTPPELTIQERQDKVLQQRNSLLVSLDWTQLPDVPLSQEQVQQYRVTRQQLRDITKSSSWATNPELALSSIRIEDK